MKCLAILSVLLFGLFAFAEETREQKEKRFADTMAESLELMDQDPTGMSNADAEKRDERVEELEEIVKSLATELAGDDPREMDKILVELLKKHRPDAKLDALRRESRESDCKSRIKGLSVHVYVHESQKKRWPDSIDDLKRKGLIEDEERLACPVHGGAYIYVKPAQGDQTPPGHIMFYCAKQHGNGARIACTFGGAVKRAREGVFLAALKAGGIAEYEPRFSGVTMEFVKKDGKTWLKVKGKLENLGDPKLTGVLTSRAILTLSLSLDPDYYNYNLSEPMKIKAAAGAREAAFEIEVEATDSPKGLTASLKVEDTGSFLKMEQPLTIPGADGK